MNNRRLNVPIIIGLLLIAAALILTAYNLFTENAAANVSDETVRGLRGQMPEIRQINESTGDSEEDIPDYIYNPDIEMPKIDIDGTGYIATLTIPALNLELPVCGEYTEANLKKAPCRYAGSAYKDNIIICAHNYRKHFAYLKSLQIGDIIYLADMDGNLFTYSLVQMEILNPENVEEFYAGDWDLTLFTCTVSGSQRIVARFEKTE